MYRIRFIIMMIRLFLKKPIKITDTFDLHFWVIPFVDTDFTRLFTQTYAAWMGLARWFCVFGTELRGPAIKNKWAPVTTAETFTYKKSIKAFSRVILRTRLVGWDDERFYVEHLFIVNGETKGHCYLEGLIRSPQKIMKPGDVYKEAGMVQESIPYPKDLKIWIEHLRALEWPQR